MIGTIEASHHLLTVTVISAVDIKFLIMSPNEIQSEIFEPKKFRPGEETFDEVGAKFYKLKTDLNYKHKYNAIAVTAWSLFHVGGLYGLYLILTFKLKLLTFAWGILLTIGSLLGSIYGHRGFCHRAFKMTTFGKVILITLQTLSGQRNIYWWSRDHRLHHKFVDTDADPYNVKRGFFFSHIGWLLMFKHPLLKEKGKTIDMSDMESDKLIMFQKKYYVLLFLLINIAIPVGVPMYFWNENFWIGFYTVFMYRWVHTLNTAWSVNSISHRYGPRPFDARISARMSKVCDIITLGESWHNYHHVFPMHYTISEFGYGGGLGTSLLHLMEKLGIAYDLRTVSSTVVYNHMKRHGDGSIKFNLKTD